MFKTPQELQEKIAAYFAECDPHMEEITEWVEARNKDGTLKKDESGMNYLVEVTHKVLTKQIPYTITGLAIFLGTSRETINEYSEKEGFVDSIKAAKDKCESYAEKMLYMANNVTGTIFNLKNNYGWKDKSEVDNTGEVTHKWEDLTDEQLDAALKARENKTS